MSQDTEYFRRRAAEARAASSFGGRDEKAAIAGELALAYRALAKRRAAIDRSAVTQAIPLADQA